MTEFGEMFTRLPLRHILRASCFLGCGPHHVGVACV